MIQSKIQFYFMPESPACRMVQMVASTVGVKFVDHYVNLLAGDHFKEEQVKINPAKKLPFIIDGDLRMNESRAIGAYLVNKYIPEGNDFYPKEAKARARVEELMCRDMSLFAFCGQLYRRKIFDHKPLCPDAFRIFTREMEAFDGRLSRRGSSRFLLGEHLTLADVCFAATLTFPEACEFDMQQFKYIPDYQSNLKEAIKDYAEINDQAVDNMRKLVRSIKIEE